MPSVKKVRSLESLRKLDDGDLQRYFERHAEYNGTRFGGYSVYSIRIDAKSIFSHDTADLRQKFFRVVKEGAWPEPDKETANDPQSVHPA